MTTSPRRADRGRVRRPWFRSFHRWLGGLAALFVVLLSLTGVALNHGHDWRLDQRHVTWPWLLDLYGVSAPAPGASFAEAPVRLTLMGERLYLDGALLAEGVEALTGTVLTEGLVVAATRDELILATPDGQLVERFAVGDRLAGPIEALGLREGRVVARSGEGLFVADAAISAFAPAAEPNDSAVAWSRPSAVPPALLRELQTDYRGRGVTVERLISDLHSGRIAGQAGPYLMDFVAVSLVILSVTGLFQWRRQGRRRRRER